MLALDIPHKGGRMLGFRSRPTGRRSPTCPTTHRRPWPGPGRVGAHHEAAVPSPGGVDLLVHDAQHTAEELPARAHFGHSAAEYAVGLAMEADAKAVLPSTTTPTAPTPSSTTWPSASPTPRAGHRRRRGRRHRAPAGARPRRFAVTRSHHDPELVNSPHSGRFTKKSRSRVGAASSAVRPGQALSWSVRKARRRRARRPASRRASFPRGPPASICSRTGRWSPQLVAPGGGPPSCGRAWCTWESPSPDVTSTAVGGAVDHPVVAASRRAASPALGTSGSPYRGSRGGR